MRASTIRTQKCWQSPSNSWQRHVHSEVLVKFNAPPAASFSKPALFELSSWSHLIFSTSENILITISAFSSMHWCGMRWCMSRLPLLSSFVVCTMRCAGLHWTIDSRHLSMEILQVQSTVSQIFLNVGNGTCPARYLFAQASPTWKKPVLSAATRWTWPNFSVFLRLHRLYNARMRFATEIPHI